MTLVHPSILKTRHLHWPDEAACDAFARRLCALGELRNAYIALQGPLGAGKTTLVRHLLRGLGIGGRIKSPTYAVLEPYEVGGLEISHFDFYRFTSPHEFEDAGFREVFARPGLKLAEWPSQVGAALPIPDLGVYLEPDGELARNVQLSAHTPTGLALLQGATNT